MSFFKDLKEDIAQSVNELTESLDENLAVDYEKTKETVSMSELTTDFPPEEPTEEVPELVVENNETEENEIEVAAGPEEVIEESVEAPVEEVVDEPEEIEESVEDYEEEDVMNEEVMEEAMEGASIDNTPVEEVEDDAQEVTVITKGTTINGGIKSDTSLVVKGTIEGDVECEGKLTITGKVAGNTIASEIYVNIQPAAIRQPGDHFQHTAPAAYLDVLGDDKIGLLVLELDLIQNGLAGVGRGKREGTCIGSKR